MAFKNRLIVSLDIEPKTIREFIKTCSKEANCNEYELLNTCKIALINTIYGPSCEALIYELGKEEALKRINLFLLQNKYRY
jgi:glutamyl/glutaminyl-tRNA synthetase